MECRCGKARAEHGQEVGQRARYGGAGKHRRITLTRVVRTPSMLSPSPSKITDLAIPGASLRPADPAAPSKLRNTRVTGHRGSGAGAAQHGDLVRQHEDLGVLGGVGAGEQRQPAQYANQHQVGTVRRPQRAMMLGWLWMMVVRLAAMNALIGHRDAVLGTDRAARGSDVGPGGVAQRAGWPGDVSEGGRDHEVAASGDHPSVAR